ncbi:rhodanese-like domain-containing protein [Alteromonas sp. ALT199]|jgi:rhodanese-related sulfurtransferase|uniref:rhodanese-like domain-containing protein n=1 Tax=unclassified Alteromonas TaxID=2614992 RepID=UPI0004537D1A|nr:rhodanese-like domain-containing protein [Alteromonas sp. ALT199]MBT3136741.1 rhodanese-like domain-containing protein [Alteromonas sp. ALT199]
MLIDIKSRINNIDFDIRSVTAEQAFSELQHNNGTLIDVREASEVEKQPVPTALHIPRGILEMKALERFKDASTPLYIHCASGIRAKLAAEQLMNMGYDRVSVVTCSVPIINQANEK